MKVLWICNLPLPAVAKVFGCQSFAGGWLDGMSNELKKSVTLSIVFPQQKRDKTIYICRDEIHYYGFYKKDIHSFENADQMIHLFGSVIKKVQPDLIHIFGTEYPHSMEMLLAADKAGVKAVISIQGLISVCAQHYLDGIDSANAWWSVFRNGRLTNLYIEMQELKTRGILEKELIKKSRFIIGRTDWDEANVKQINNSCRYFRCNEIMRPSFYDEEWKLSEVKKYSIFVSQANYAIKGFHHLIKALPVILASYPEAHVYVAGSSTFLKQRDPYGRYLQYLMKKCGVCNNITFCGPHTEVMMKKRYLNSHVTVMCSNIENSPNSIAEAMLLGVPVVSSYVGGISSMVDHGINGFLYQSNAPEMLAYYIKKVFGDSIGTEDLSRQEKEKAKQLYDREKNNKRLLEIYCSVLNETDCKADGS